jgi:hypothetical protein
MPRHVKGTLFVDYVRMLRSRKDVDWASRLSPPDLQFLQRRVEPNGWYPMETFERFGLLILDEIAKGDLLVVRAWGRLSVDPLVALHEGLLVRGDPRESLMRFQVLRRSFFDFEAVTIPELSDHSARVHVDYGMSPRAEQAACVQTQGFFARLVELAGGGGVRADFERRAWEGDTTTVVALDWDPPARS